MTKDLYFYFVACFLVINYVYYILSLNVVGAKLSAILNETSSIEPN
jgi:hypothetical protein